MKFPVPISMEDYYTQYYTELSDDQHRSTWTVRLWRESCDHLQIEVELQDDRQKPIKTSYVVEDLAEAANSFVFKISTNSCSESDPIEDWNFPSGFVYVTLRLHPLIAGEDEEVDE